MDKHDNCSGAEPHERLHGLMANLLRLRLFRWGILGLAVAVGTVLTISCVPVSGPPDGEPIHANTTDPTNRGASFIGATSCRLCHTEISDAHLIHGHAHKLTRVSNGAPEFPDEATLAGVPQPPEGFGWADISYVIGGYTKKARFIDKDGFILTTGVEGVPTQWNLAFPAGGKEAQFVPYEATAVVAPPYGFSCFECHTTNPQRQDDDFPQFQDERPGFLGTWLEPGIQCEACHGPGSKHFTTIGNEVVIDRSAIFVDVSANACAACHRRGTDMDIIPARNGYIRHREQWQELLASGGHANMDCIVCHDPHTSVIYDRENAIRNECTSCHSGHNMALHEGLTYVHGDYVEQISCESCHMPFAGRSATNAGPDVVGGLGRMGDVKSHIFRIDTTSLNFETMFTPDGSAVRKDSEGRAALTLDFVCFRCHHGIGNAAAFMEPERAKDVASGIHATIRP